jgi:hypothetical protein
MPASLTPDQRSRLFKDIQETARVVGPQTAQWLREAIRAATGVANGNRDLIPVFWIRTYGIMHDIRDKVVSQIEFGESVGAPPVTQLPVRNAIDNLIAEFSDDELVYVQYRRHVECHPYQNSYKIRISQRGLKESVSHHLIDKQMTVTETTDTIRRVLNPPEVDEERIAFTFAKRAVPLLENVRAVSVPWCGG